MELSHLVCFFCSLSALFFCCRCCFSSETPLCWHYFGSVRPLFENIFEICLHVWCAMLSPCHIRRNNKWKETVFIRTTYFAENCFTFSSLPLPRALVCAIIFTLASSFTCRDSLIFTDILSLSFTRHALSSEAQWARTHFSPLTFNITFFGSHSISQWRCGSVESNWMLHKNTQSPAHAQGKMICNERWQKGGIAHSREAKTHISR